MKHGEHDGRGASVQRVESLKEIPHDARVGETSGTGSARQAALPRMLLEDLLDALRPDLGAVRALGMGPRRGSPSLCFDEPLQAAIQSVMSEVLTQST